jgi:uncharacterized metal-binding protein
MSVEAQKTIQMTATRAVCPIGESTGKKNLRESRIPVLSCEGACIRGEIARLAANIIAREADYGRGCHGELLTVPDSAIARWIKSAEKVILIDGCFLRCHGRIMENILAKDKLIQFDALSHYNKYTDIFDYEAVPEKERREVAQSVAAWVMDNLENPVNKKVPACAAATQTCSSCGG